MWASLHGHSSFSLLDGIVKPKNLIQRSLEVGYTAVALTDHGRLSGLISLLNEKKKAGEKAKHLKIIFGNEFYINNGEGKPNTHCVILARNLAGWKSLIKATSESNKPENFYRKPRLSLDQLEGFAKGNLFAINGHAGSCIGNIIFSDVKSAYSARSYDEVKSFVKDNWKKELFDLIDKYVQVFGKDCFALEIQTIDESNFPAAILLGKTLRWAAKQLKLRTIATSDAHYETHNCNKDQWVVLSSNIGVSIPKIEKKLIADDDDTAFAGFFRSNNYHMPTPEEIALVNTEEEMMNAVEIAEEIEEIDPFSKPIIPKFDCPEEKESGEYFKEICRQGWRDKIQGKIPKDQIGVYGERIKYELDVLLGAGLSDYFLILNDIANFVKSNAGLVNTGRGSVSGCLASYLSGITSVDPIPFGLIFERFYNAGRNSAGRISMPDIDLDIQASFRDKTVDYIKDKYGKEKVGNIGTFGRLMGRACLKEVLRAWEVCNAKEMDKITQCLTDESSIMDDLQEMSDEDGEASIIRWALENNSKELKEWATLDRETGKVNGPFGIYFEQAMRIEGTHKSMGSHAAGIVISNTDISDVVPVRYDRNNGKAIIDVSMEDVEKLGLLKFDLLSVSVLDKIQCAEKMIKECWNESG